MEVKLLKDVYKDWDHGVDWSNFGHTAQRYFVYARISMQTSDLSTAVIMSHQMVELFVKAIILKEVFNSDYDTYDLLRQEKRGKFHDVIDLMESNKEEVEFFHRILSNSDYLDFIANNSVHYVDTRFGQTTVSMKLDDDLKSLDGIFQEFTRYLYSITGVRSFKYLSIPAGTEPMFLDAQILDFSAPSCRQFRNNTIGNIKVLI